MAKAQFQIGQRVRVNGQGSDGIIEDIWGESNRSDIRPQYYIRFTDKKCLSCGQMTPDRTWVQEQFVRAV